MVTDIENKVIFYKTLLKYTLKIPVICRGRNLTYCILCASIIKELDFGTRFRNPHIQQKKRSAMQIVQVSTRQLRRHILLKGWGSVGLALNTYANGFTRGAKTTEQVTVDAIGKSHGSNEGLAVGMFLLCGAMIGNRSKLVDELLKEAEEGLKTRTNFHKSYDYDGMGTAFFKTSIDIEVLDREQDMYGIGIHAAYVGDEPEQGLAEHFGITRMLLWCSVEVETEPLSDNRFEFDFKPVLRKLDAVLDTKDITGKQVVAAMMTESVSLVLQVKDGLEVRIQPGRVDNRVKYTQGKPRDTWSSEGSVLSGELQRDYGSSDENAKATPTFLIVICSSQKDGWRNSLPIWQLDSQQRAIALTNKIAAALR